MPDSPMTTSERSANGLAGMGAEPLRSALEERFSIWARIFRCRLTTCSSSTWLNQLAYIRNLLRQRELPARRCGPSWSLDAPLWRSMCSLKAAWGRFLDRYSWDVTYACCRYAESASEPLRRTSTRRSDLRCLSRHASGAAKN